MCRVQKAEWKNMSTEQENTSLLIDFWKNLPPPIVGLPYLLHFWFKMVEGRAMGAEVRSDVYMFIQQGSAHQSQAIWQQKTLFKRLEDWSLDEGMLGWFEVTMGPTFMESC